MRLPGATRSLASTSARAVRPGPTVRVPAIPTGGGVTLLVGHLVADEELLRPLQSGRGDVAHRAPRHEGDAGVDHAAALGAYVELARGHVRTDAAGAPDQGQRSAGGAEVVVE